MEFGSGKWNKVELFLIQSYSVQFNDIYTALFASLMAFPAVGKYSL